MKKKIILFLCVLLLFFSVGCVNNDYGIGENVNEFSYDDVYMESVDSTCFSEVGYDEENEVLLVRFLESGSLYAYSEISYNLYEDFILSDSLGTYYNSNIKGLYNCERIE